MVASVDQPEEARERLIKMIHLVLNNYDPPRSQLYVTLTSKLYSKGSVKSVLSLSIVVNSNPTL